MYGYCDYEGPNTAPLDFEDDDPLRSGYWMEGDSLAPPCGSSLGVLHALLDLGDVRRDDVLYDMGCGDGRVCLEAFAKYGCRCVGVEIEDDLINRFQFLAERLGVRGRVEAVKGDLREILNSLNGEHPEDGSKGEEELPRKSLPAPTVICLYLLPEGIGEIEACLMELLRKISNLRILCNTWGLEGMEPSKSVEVAEAGSCASTVISMYDGASLKAADMKEIEA